MVVDVKNVVGGGEEERINILLLFYYLLFFAERKKSGKSLDLFILSKRLLMCVDFVV